MQKGILLVRNTVVEVQVVEVNLQQRDLNSNYNCCCVPAIGCENQFTVKRAHSLVGQNLEKQRV